MKIKEKKKFSLFSLLIYESFFLMPIEKNKYNLFESIICKKIAGNFVR